jgi:predicted dehydrogenase
VAHLPFYVHSPDYEIVALCNSSVEAAQRSIEVHGLPKTTRAYGDPQDIAADADVDLIVVSVSVFKHFMLTEPALLNKKQVFVEWPLGATTQEAETLAKIAQQNDLKTIVGVQGRSSKLMRKLKEIVDQGLVGKITSTSVLGSTCALPTTFWLKDGEYYLEMGSGGNAYTINFGHCESPIEILATSLASHSTTVLDSFIHIVGGFESLQSALKCEISHVSLIDKEGKPAGEHDRDIPDHILVQGRLRSGAMASIAWRWAELNEAADDVGLRWIITGTKGEVVITTDQSHWNMGSANRKLVVKLHRSEAYEDDFDGEDFGFAKSIPPMGINTALALDAFAKGDKGGYADFEDALEVHKTLDEIIQKAEMVLRAG